MLIIIRIIIIFYIFLSIFYNQASLSIECVYHSYSHLKCQCTISVLHNFLCALFVCFIFFSLAVCVFVFFCFCFFWFRFFPLPLYMFLFFHKFVCFPFYMFFMFLMFFCFVFLFFFPLNVLKFLRGEDWNYFRTNTAID